MDLLIHSDFLIEYFDGIFKSNMLEIQKYASEIVSNETNSIILNKNIVVEYENKLNEHFNNNLDSIYPFLNELLARKIEVERHLESNDVYKDTEMGYLSNQKYAQSVLYTNISICSSNSLKNKYSCILSEIKKFNKNWLIAQLARLKNDSLTLRYFEFNNDLEIQNLFKELFILSDRHSEIYIYDRQTNFDHKLFDSFKNTHSVHYYTAFSNAIDKAVDQKIKTNFKRVKIFKIQKNLIHERKILIKDLIIEVDNDFWNIKHTEPTWKIDISLCVDIYTKLITKNVRFKRVYI